MKESSFVNQNKDKWKHYEGLLNRKSQEPDELNDLFIQVTDDLSYARSFYPNRSVRVYLNNLAQKVFLKLYTNRKSKQSFFLKFFKQDLPLILYSARKEMAVCFLIFVLTFLIGVFSSRHQPDFARQILGADYVEMTNQNIKDGKPMNVYVEGDKLTSFFGIALNNLRVDLLTFITGFIFGIGALFVLAYNGVMVGVFQYFFYNSGYLTLSIFTIWLHGTLEVFCMILSATAGLVFGKGLIFTGTYTRTQAFQISAIKGVKILLAVLPLTIIAAFIESFITGQSQAPLAIKALLIVLSLSIIIFYFIWFPYHKFYKTGLAPEEDELPEIRVPELAFNDIKTVGEVLTDAFRVWKKYLSIILLISFGLSVILVGSVYFLESDRLSYNFTGIPGYLFSLIQLFNINHWFKTDHYQVWPTLILIFSFYSVFIHSKFFASHIWIDINLKKRLPRFLIASLLLIVMLCLFYFSNGVWWLIFYFFIAFPLAISINSHIFNTGLKSIQIGVYYFFNSIISKFLLNLSLLILLFIIYLMASSPILNFLFEIITSSLQISNPNLLIIEKLTINAAALTTLLALIPLYIYANTIHYFSTQEKITAKTLKTRLEKIWG